MGKVLKFSKDDVISKYAAKYDITKKAAREEIDRYNEFHRELLAETNGVDHLEIVHPGFVKFTATRVPEHEIIFNVTGEKVTVKEKVVTKAKASKSLCA